jgi:hypothetical protein
MRLLFGFLAVTSLFLSCKSKSNIPDVSNIKIELTTQRFEQDFFKLDSLHMYTQLEQLEAKYPAFGENFLVKILNINPNWPADSIQSYVGGFLNAYQKVYIDATAKIKDFTPYENEIKKGLQFVKYYFPNYKIPRKVITYIGPVDGYGDALAEDAFLIGLHHHLGKDYPLYKTEMVQESYPLYITQRFEPDYIPVNCMRNIIDDMYPQKEDDSPLINQMIEKGKRLYVLSKFLPYTDEYKLIGYTKDQLADCYTHEQMIWNLFTKNAYLQVTDKNTTKNYVDEGPKTPELGEKAPGNIGSFSGWQIIKKYMQKNEKISLEELMKTDDEIIVQEAKYKP